MIEREKIEKILCKAPFNLTNECVNWVMHAIESLSTKEKISQLFNIQIFPGEQQLIDDAIRHKVGGVTLINFDSPLSCKSVIHELKNASNMPMLVCADLEGGVTSGNMTTSFPNQLGCAAANDLHAYSKALEVLAQELLSIGINWTFSPVLDVNDSFHSAIVGTRSYGNNQQLISDMANAHIRVFQNKNIATTAKHWPGEGFDARDQHLVTTINPLSAKKWDEVFGQLYTRAFDAGVLSVMSAHIALPDFAASMGEEGVERFRPASISAHLNKTLLREKLRFNGLVISDATLMGGLESWGPRKQWLPELIQNGCDMILFSTSLGDDIETLYAAVQTGALSSDRVDEALVRVLGLKAKLKLHQPMQPSDIEISVIDSDEHKAVMSNLSSMSVTLVKDTQNVVPIDISKTPKVLIFKEENINPLGGGEDFHLHIDKLLIAEGFDVHVFDPLKDKLEVFNNFDLIIYAIAQESQLTKSRLYLDWATLHGGTLPGMKRLWWDKPTMLISFGHPYYLYDAPRFPCLVNAYTPTPDVQKAVVDKLIGRSGFTGKSPVDAFCGLSDAIF